MKEKDKNKIHGPEDFMRYRKDNLSNSERNAFERELQKDPFSGEAAEGFSSVSPEQAKSDLTMLGKRLKSRTSKPVRYTIYRIAASMAVLMVISTVYFLVIRTNPTKQEKIADPKTEVSSAAGSPAEKKHETNEVLSVSQPAPAPSGTIAETRSESEIKSRETTSKLAEKEDADKAMIGDEAQKTLKTVKAGNAAVNELTIADAAVIKTDSVNKFAAEPEISVTAKDQAASAGAMEKKARSVKAIPAGMAEGNMPAEYSRGTAPQPVNGMESYKRYIEENIRIPAGHTGSDTVIVSFIVRINGNPERISIVESPGKVYSEEAVRLIKEGPVWSPASENGVIKEKEVILKIVFK
jgi:hypothetical protein